MQRILIFNYNWLGDVIFSTPAIRAIKKAYPDSYIACLVVPRCCQILEANPHIDEVIDFDETGLHKSLRGKIKLIKELRLKKFDIAFIFHRSFTRALMMLLSRIPWRIGYATKHRGWILTCSLGEPKKPIHKVNYLLNLVKASTLWWKEKDKIKKTDAVKAELELSVPEEGDEDYEFIVSEDMITVAGKILQDCGLENTGDKFAVLNPGANWPPKRWTVDNFVQTGDLITEKTGMPIVITGAEKDKETAKAIAAKMKKKPVITCGRTDINILAGILRLSDIVVTADSGPMHLAVAVGARVVTIFGPTSPELSGPKGKGNYKVIQQDIECSIPCYDQTCTDNICMRLTKPEEVIEAILEV